MDRFISWTVVAFLSLASSVLMAADQFWVMRTSTANVCRVQKSTESPIGNRFKGPFDTKPKATKAMCDNYDSSMEDPSKCWAVLPKDACEVPEAAKPSKPGAK
jgi:hypothetical protein